MDFLNKLIALIAGFFNQQKPDDELTIEWPLPKPRAGVDADQLCKIYGCTAARASMYVDHINAAMDRYQINLTPLRMAHFLAQIGHESGRLLHTVEIWGPTPAQSRYEGRKDLGNVQSGDGERFKGRGLIQLTGRSNYAQLEKAFGIDVVAEPKLLSQPLLAAMSAGWYWDSRGLNAHADNDDLLTITKRINGGTNGLEDRKALLAKAKRLYGI